MIRESAGLRQAAKAAGERTYITGFPCPQGHTVSRYTSTGNCVTCAKDYVRTRGAYFRTRYGEKKVEILRKERVRRRANPEKTSAAVRAWQIANAEKVREYKRKNKHKRRAAVGVFSQSDVLTLQRIQRDECAGCSARLFGKFHVDHIIPLSRGGTNWCGNIQLLCAGCNYRKSDRLPVEWRRARHTVNPAMLEAA